jgi:hypothetical protein
MSTDPHITGNQGGTPSTMRSGSGSSPSHLGDTLRWAFELDASPTLAGATWLTREIVPGARDPFDAIVAPTTSIEALEQLKSAYKMLRTGGTTTTERSLAARLYAATIAAALVRHGRLITSQRGEALIRAFSELESDTTMPEPLRSIASQALTAARRA